MMRIRAILSFVLAGSFLLIPAAVSAQTPTTPDPGTLQQQSIVAVKTGLHQAQATGTLKGKQGSARVSVDVTAACAATSTRITARQRMQGTVPGAKGPQAFKQDDGLIWSLSPSWFANFLRSKDTKGKWQTIDMFDSSGMGFLGNACPMLLVRALEMEPWLNLTLVGTASVGGATAWQLRSTVSTNGTSTRRDLYIDQQSMLPVRLVVKTTSSGTRYQETVNFSKLNEPVTIALPSMKVALGRGFHSATLLTSGKVLVTGGAGAGFMPGWAELYDPSTGTWSRTGDLVGASLTPAVALPDGKALTVSGLLPFGVGGSTPAAAAPQVYDSTTNTWTIGARLNVPRSMPALFALPDGNALVVGGIQAQSGLLVHKAERYDSITGSWSVTGATSSGTCSFVRALAAALPNGKLLVVTYKVAPTGSTNSISADYRVFDSWKGTWSAAPFKTGPDGMLSGLWHLPNGKLLGIGSKYDETWTWIYEPVKKRWTESMAGGLRLVDRTGRVAATLLKNGRLLVLEPPQQELPGIHIKAAYVFDPSNSSWKGTGSMHAARMGASLTLLPNGKALAVGGMTTSAVLSSAELYDPATGKWTRTGSMK